MGRLGLQLVVSSEGLFSDVLDRRGTLGAGDGEPLAADSNGNLHDGTRNLERFEGKTKGFFGISNSLESSDCSKWLSFSGELFGLSKWVVSFLSIRTQVLSGN